MEPVQSLISSKSSDSGLHIQLHPLVLLTISDHITRHAARQQQGPILGALLGQQNGREITLEHVFECPVTTGENGEALLPSTWFEERLKQFKDVHKDPALDLVGWWSTAPPSGPDASHIPLHKQILQDHNESAVFLAFHPSEVQSREHGAKLPLAIYETVLEGENAADAGKDMQIDGEEPTLNIRFRELPYSVETEEAEMIGVDTIAQTAGTASRTEIPSQGTSASAGQKLADKEQKSSQAELTQEEEELIANLNTRLNAIRTLESRISLIKSYVSSISATDSSAAAQDDPSSPKLSHPIIRNINSLISHLSILSPHEQSSFATEVLSQSNDVTLVSLLGQLGESVKAMRELGRKSAVVQAARHSANSRKQPNLAARAFEDELFAHGIPPSGEAGGMYS
ncbi:COP9 signalosome complex subunit 6 [Penicillium subrubescens]|uniref:COP9 signalosome complex subunit 6 n=1 Tax=Penicillium subrubescens TaxID=1316194 RepID=A0A1Q5U9S7_9EURO|nr:COP9 signalosome complex subunit 6 [Penicillium subrubescens]KAJ5906946.1 COP9 signalosome complex subunit 6 [Penicillium subrubescens]OKP09221.1 COP9 signalosome complex subunit 6 [Penicillium subrubescens]